jgi:hypothetical protein
LRREDPDFVPPRAANGSAILALNGKVAVEKRQRDDESVDGERQPKREKIDDDDGEEMEIDEEEESAQPSSTSGTFHHDFWSLFLLITLLQVLLPCLPRYNRYQHDYCVPICHKK